VPSINPVLKVYPADRVRDPLAGLSSESYSATTSAKIHELKEKYEAKYAALSSGSTTIQNANIDHDPENDCQGCQVHILGGTDLAECSMDRKWCRWAMYFGTTRFCKHPSAKQFANSNQAK
jgi:hypothetical protein